MKIGFVSDAHGNPVGLANCIELLRAQGADRLYFLGDAIGYLPYWREVLQILRTQNVVCIRGNHEDMMLSGEITEAKNRVYNISAERTASIAEYMSWISGWPIQLDLEFDGMKLLLVHGSPVDPLNGYVYPDTDLAELIPLDRDAVLMGHTHRPFVRHVEERIAANVGSCGLPRDVGNLSSCAMLDTSSRSVSIFRTEFDPNLLNLAGQLVHDSVRNCLARSGPYYGELVPNDAGSRSKKV